MNFVEIKLFDVWTPRVNFYAVLKASLKLLKMEEKKYKNGHSRVWRRCVVKKETSADHKVTKIDLSQDVPLETTVFDANFFCMGLLIPRMENGLKSY